MGQYYKPVSLKDGKPQGWVYSHDIKYRFKRDDGQIFMMGNGLKLMEHSWLKNEFVQTIETLLTLSNPWFMTGIVWAGDYAKPEYSEMKDGKEVGRNLYDLCEDDMKTTKKRMKLPKGYDYIVNHTKHQYVNKKNVRGNDGWIIHPLPLLTWESDENGGGDFRGEDPKGLIGSWARDIISVEMIKPMGMEELIFDLVE